MTTRFFMLQAHYSSTLDFTNDALDAAEKGYKRLMNALGVLDKLEISGSGDPKVSEEIKTNLKEAMLNLCDDLNTAKCIANLFELSSIINAIANNQSSAPDGDTLVRLRKEFRTLLVDVLGLMPEAQESGSNTDGLMQLLIELRQNARKNKDFATSDRIRDQLAGMGIQLKDGPSGTEWSLVNLQ